MSRPTDEPEDDEDALNQLEARRATLDCLAAEEAASMLAGLPPSEASQLLLLIGEEKRTAAIGAMSAKARAALAAAMPADTAAALGLVGDDVDSGSSTSEEQDTPSAPESVPGAPPVAAEVRNESGVDGTGTSVSASANIGSSEEGTTRKDADKEAEGKGDRGAGLQGSKEQRSEVEGHVTPSLQSASPVEIHHSPDHGSDIQEGGVTSVEAVLPTSTGSAEVGTAEAAPEAGGDGNSIAGQQDGADHAETHAPAVATMDDGDDDDEDAAGQMEARRATLACLSSEEAAAMLEGLPSREAAQLVMLLGNDSAGAALRLMSVEARSALKREFSSGTLEGLGLEEEEGPPPSEIQFSPPPRVGAEAEGDAISEEHATEHAEGVSSVGTPEGAADQSGADVCRKSDRRQDEDGEELEFDSAHAQAPAECAGTPDKLRATSGPEIEAWVVSGQRAVQGPEISLSPQGVAHFAMEEDDDGDLMDQMPSPLHHEYQMPSPLHHEFQERRGPDGDASPASLSRSSTNGSIPSSEWVKDRVSKTVEWGTSSKIGTQAKGAAETAAVKARQGLAQAADSDAAKKAKEAAVIARQGCKQAADKAAPKVAVMSGKAMDAAGTAAERASKATEAARSEAKHKAEAAADKAKVGLAQVSKGLMGFVRKTQAKEPPPS